MKKIGFGFSKMDKDTAANARKPENYHDALNMINTATEDNVNGGIMSDRGNTESIRIPNIVNDQQKPGTFYTTYDTTAPTLPPSTFIQSYPYTNPQFIGLPILVVPKIIGQVEHKEFIYLVTTGSVGTPTGTNDGQVWEFNTQTNNLRLVYHGFLNLSLDFPITGIHFIEETESNKRLYFIDHYNQLQVINVANPDVFNLPATAFQIIGETILYAPELIGTSRGGLFQAGLVAYAYQYYNTNGTFTKLSPLSEYININEQYKGNEETEKIGISTNLEINNLDGNYSGIRLYRIHYINPDQSPLVHLIAEHEYNIPGTTARFVDDGANNIALYSLEELLYLYNRTVFTGRAVTTKDNHMFIGNLKEYPYLPDYDARAYRWNTNSIARVETSQGNFVNLTSISQAAALDSEHDAINPSNYAEERNNNVQPGGFYFGSPDPLYRTYHYQFNGSTIGGEGPNIKYTFKTELYRPAFFGSINDGFTLNQNSFAEIGNYDQRGYKRDEIYRFGIILYNKYMQASPVNWIGDIRFPTTDDNNGDFELTHQSLYSSDPVNYPMDPDQGKFRKLYIEFRVSNLPSDCIGYQIVRVPRTDIDKTIPFQALVQPMVIGNNRNFIGNIPAAGISQVTTPFDEYRNLIQPTLFNRAVSGTLLGIVGSNWTYSSTPNISNGLNAPQSWWAGWPVFGLSTSPGPFNSSYNFSTIYPTADAASGGTTPQERVTTRQTDAVIQLYSPEIELHKSNTMTTSPSYLKTIGGIDVLRRGTTKFQNSYADTSSNFQVGFNNQAGNVNDPNTWGIIYYEASNRVQTNKDQAKVVQLLDIPEFTPESQNDNPFNINTPTKYSFNQSNIEFTNDIAHVLVNAANGDGVWYADNNDCITARVGNPVSGLLNESFTNMITDTYQEAGLTGGTTTYTSAFALNNHANTSAFNQTYNPWPIIERQKWPLVDYKIFNRTSIYIGNSYEARSNNNYIPVTNFIPATTATTLVKNGDTFLSFWALERTSAKQVDPFFRYGTIRNIMMFPIETTINIDARTDNWRSYLRDIDTLFSKGPKYNDIYQYEPTNFNHFPLPLNYTPNTKFDYRLVASNSKVYGEYLDNWSLYEFNQVMDLDPARGHISNMHRLGEDVIAIQSQGISLLKINPDITVSSEQGSQIELAAGSLLYSNTYIDRTAGASATFGSAELPGALIIVDDLNKKIKLFSSEGNNVISDVLGISSYLRKEVNFDLVRLDNPYKNTGVAIGYYPDKQMVYLTFNLLDVTTNIRPQPDNSFTLGYSFLQQGFTSRYSFTPQAYVSSLGRIYSIPDNESVWKHETGLYANYYGVQYESSISLFGTSEGMYNSTWDTLSYTGRLTDLNGNDIYDESFTSIRVYNEHQDTGVVSLVNFTNHRHRDRRWNVGLPRVQGSRARISNPWAIMELSYLGDGTKRIIVDSANATYRLYPSSYI